MKANAEQETEGWMQARAGNFTASRASDLMAKTRSGPGASRANLIATLAVERITGECVVTYANDAMRRGTELEGEARDAYSFERGVAVLEVGYVAHPSLVHVGASPDGLVGDDGLVELKCPASMQKHLDALRTGAHAVEYRWQLQHQLMVTGRQWVDAVSYDPRYPAGLQLAIFRVNRNAQDIAELMEGIASAELDVEGIVTELRERLNAPKPALEIAA